LRIAHEELRFIRKDSSDSKKIVQVKWNSETSKWYPIAFRIMLKLMTDKRPCEFATELLLPFTVEAIRDSLDPLKALAKIDPDKMSLEPWVERWIWYFDKCGSQTFATQMADLPIFDGELMQSRILGFSVTQMKEAASFHGDIGEAAKTLDHHAVSEQKLVSDDTSSTKSKLSVKAQQYLTKFGFKFLVSAKGKSSEELLSILTARIDNSPEAELKNANAALAEIALKRSATDGADHMIERLRTISTKHQITGFQVGVSDGKGIQTLVGGFASKGSKPVLNSTLFEIASLSKSIATAFAFDYFSRKGIPLTESVNKLFDRTLTSFRLKSDINPQWADQVTIEHLVSHAALNMHYVNGFPADGNMPALSDLIFDSKRTGYPEIRVINEPGKVFSYSGGGFIVLEYLIEQLEKVSIQTLIKPFLEHLGLSQLTFMPKNVIGYDYADGYLDHSNVVQGGRYMFPAFAAGACGNANDVMKFLSQLTAAFHNPQAKAPLSHDTAVKMLHGTDRGCREFMGCKMGLGIFVAEMGPNRVAIHQGANEGFRALFFYVVDGPDRDKGFTILCNGDNKAVACISEMSRLLIETLRLSGYDLTATQSAFDFSKLSQEQIVNLGYRNLIFAGLTPTLPEEIHRTSNQHPLTAWDIMQGATLEFASNQRFARAVNLIHPCEPEFDPALFGSQGKIMDSWESSRHNDSACDEVIFSLRHPSDACCVRLSTKFHDGNQAPLVKIWGQQLGQDTWSELLPFTTMTGHAERMILLNQPMTNISKVKVAMYPDGGLTRVSIYSSELPQPHKTLFLNQEESQSVRFKDEIPKSKKPLVIPYTTSPSEIEQNYKRAAKFGLKIDYASMAYGGQLLAATNEHYGPAIQVISPFPPIHMFDGLESARSRKDGHYEEVELKLGTSIEIAEIQFDFKFFTNNNPRSLEIAAMVDGAWKDLSGKIDVKGYAGNSLVVNVGPRVNSERLRVRTYPDGGVNRIHVYSNH
jgi:allantoicase/CubicO group peptidase (beta-lactamase class C family)